MSKPQFVDATYIETTAEKVRHALTNGEAPTVPLGALGIEGVE